ncbi:hypothetical protein QNI16_20825 [Cytophagaceae bacterium YF14B1]|uniref:TonB-dependent receptor n=1 Tax=Xanthocytophaga flava TaxID=3048013 RepID=A0AAE3UAP1_9BACT|nr:hypothetical protein [Xanthocytophaga flavus]MDJ1482959.1 hypothetical protein [Xanthocytophaga flavus]
MTKQSIRYLFLCLVFSLTLIQTKAQNLESFGVKKGIKANGSLNLNAIGYTASGIPVRRDPFAWFVSGNLTLNLFGYAAPFSFSYSNTSRSFTQPFNQLSFAPQYKWVKTYIGYNSMTFSQYTLSGHVFLGGGVELTPKNWRVAAMYGRLRKAVPFNLTDTTENYNASYKRMGVGFKIGYEKDNNGINVTLFHAKDDIQSIPYVLYNSNLTPKQNLVAGISGRKKLFERVSLEAEYAYSILTNNILYNPQADTLSVDSLRIPEPDYFLKGIIPSNATTRHFSAYNMSVGYQGTGYGIQVRYEEVAPEYQTLGAYYFNNDMRNITLIPSFQLFQGKLGLNANVGWQYNNLAKLKASTTKRFVGAFNAAFTPNEQWSFSGNYSNFTTFTNIRPQTDPFFRNNLDTLNYYQINNTFNGMASHNFGDKERRHAIIFNGSYQKASDVAAYEGGNNNLSDFYTGNISYSLTLVPKNITLSASANYYTSRMATVTTRYWGPNASVTTSFLNKTLRCTYAGSFNKNTTNGLNSGAVLNNRVNIGYTPAAKEKERGKHTFSLGLNLLRKSPTTTELSKTPAFTEFTATTNYSYSF